MKLKRNVHYATSLFYAVAAMVIGSSAEAADITWSGGTDVDWNVSTNWTGGSVPVTSDTVTFGAPGVGGLTLNNNLTSGSFTLNGILFTEAAGAYVIGNGTNTPNAGNTFVLGVPASTAFFTLSVTNASRHTQTIHTPFSMTTTRTFTGLGDIVLTGNISGTGGVFTKTGSNVLTLSGNNTYTGATNANLGVLRLDSANAIPGGLGATGGTSNINLNNGIIGLGAGDFRRPLGSGVSAVQFSNPGGWAAYAANRVVNLGGASAAVVWATATTGLNNRTLILGHPTATHTVDFQNPLDLTNAARTIQVDDGAAAIDGILSGNLTGVASGNLTKNGTGTLALTGLANNYVGTTTVNAGSLLVNGTKSGAGAITVNAGAALGGTGSVTGATTVAAGGRVNLADGVVGTLNLVNNLTFSGSTATPNLLLFDLGNGGAGTDKIHTAAAHSAGTAAGAQVHLNQLSGTAINAGTYTLIQGGAASTFTGYTLATERAGRNAYSNLIANGNNLEVTVGAGNPGPAEPFTYWRGEIETFWDSPGEWYSDAAGTTLSAIPGYSSNVRFATANTDLLSTSLFLDFEINSLTVDASLAGPVSIGTKMLTIGATTDNGNTAGNGITANNQLGTTISSRVGLGRSQTWTVGTDATMTVSGAISDFGNGHTLTKAGAGTLNLSAVNVFSGPLTINAGTLAVTGAGQLNSGNYGANIVNNGTLIFNSSAAQTLNGTISGSGALVKSNSNTLTLNNSGLFTGGATINGGSFTVGQANMVNPLGTGTTTVGAGGTYALSATLITAPVILNGGTITAGNSFTSFMNGPVTLGDATTSTINVSGNLTINGNISGTGGLLKSNSAFVPLNGPNNTYTGATTITGGGLTVKSSLYGNDTSKWIPANIIVNSGGSLVMNVGGTGEFTIAQAGTMFSQLGGAVNNNGLRAGSTFGVDLRNTSGTFTISDNLTDSTGTGGGTVSFRIVGNGTTAGAVVELTGNNTYSGQTIVDRSGAIRVSSLNSVNGGNPLLASSSLGRPTTVANGTIQLGTNVSFQGASLIYTGTGETTDRVVNLGGSNGTTYRFDQSGTGVLKFTSAFTITDNRGVKTIELQGSTAGVGEIAASIPNGETANPNRVTKQGTGTWVLSASNAYVGLTTVSGGTLLLSHVNALNGGIGATGGLGAITFNGGVIGLGADNFLRPLAAANTIGAATFSGAGGWSAHGANRAVNLGGAVAAVTWATANTGLNGQTLILGSNTATHTVDFQNPLNLGTATRTVRVDDGAADVDGALSGILSSGSNGSLSKTGTGTLVLSAANTYSGTTAISAGTLLINGNQSGATGTVSVTGSGILGGTGTIGGAVSVTSASAKIAPGITTGILTTLGNVNIGGDLEIDINDSLTIKNDTLAVGGNLDVGSAILNLNVTGAPTQSAYVIATYATLTAGNPFLEITGMPDGYEIDYAYNDGKAIAIKQSVTQTSYDAWSAAKGLTTANNAKNLDPDGDGKNNLYEFAFDGDPLSGANDGKIVGKVASVNGSQVLTLTLPVRTGAVFSANSGDQLSALVDGIYYRIEGDETLNTFADTITEVNGGNAVAIQNGLPALSTGWAYRTFRAPGTTATNAKAFLRAKVSETP